MNRSWTLILIVLCLMGGFKVVAHWVDTPRVDEGATVALRSEGVFQSLLQKKRAPASLEKAFSTLSRGRLFLSYIAPVGESGKNLWLLAFAPKTNSRHQEYKSHSNVIASEGPVTLLIVDSNPLKEQEKWSLITSISLKRMVMWDKDPIQLRWLEPAKHRGYLLSVNVDYPKGWGYALPPFYELIVFPSGWKHTYPIRETRGGWARFDDGARYDAGMLDRVDTRGFVCLTRTDLTYNHESQDEFSTPYHSFWTGRGWSAKSP